jgi:hypothetical protein
MFITDGIPAPFRFFPCPKCNTPIPTDLPVGSHGWCKGCKEYSYSIVLLRQVVAHTYEWRHLRAAGYPVDGMDAAILVREARWERSIAQAGQPPTAPAAPLPEPAATPTSSASNPAPTGPAAKPLRKLSVALVLLSEHPDWTDKAIAEAAGCSGAYLSKNLRYRAAREAIKGIGQESRQRSRKHRGSDMDEYAEG